MVTASNSKKYNVSTYYIAYFDVLGYKDLFKDKQSDILSFLYNIVRLTEDVMNATESGVIFDNKFKVKSFSDNFIIMLDAKKSDEYQSVKALSYLVAVLQLRFLEEYRILIRGGITKGDAYIDNNIVFGEGLIKAVELEETAAFPRIILDEKRISSDTCDTLLEKCIRKDEDDKYYVDYFDILGMYIGNYADFGDDTEKHLKLLKKNISALVNKHCKYPPNLKDSNRAAIREKTISKYLWLLTKFNEYCELGDEEYVIHYELSICKKWMKCEVIVKK